MLGLITSLSRVIYSHNDARVHEHRRTSVGGEYLFYPPEQEKADEKEIKVNRLKELAFKGLGEKRWKESGNIFYAPPHMVTESYNDHKIMYMAYEFDRSTGGGNTHMGMKDGQPNTTFVFPLPTGINDKVTTEWDDETSLMKRMMGAVFSDDKKVGDAVKEEFTRFKDNVTSGARRKVSEFTPSDFYFKSVTKRDFSFTHKMSPLDETEAKSMKSIVDWIQYHSSPDIKNPDMPVQLISPAEWEIHFMSGGTDNPFLPKIKRCILESVSINDTPNENFQPLPNNYPVDVEIELTFKEIGIRTKRDISATEGI